MGASPDEEPPVPDPFGRDGWYFSKEAADPAAKKLNYYFINTFVAAGSNLNPTPPVLFGDILSQWAVVTFDTFPTDQAPFFAVYTTPTVACIAVPANCISFIDFKVLYQLSVPTVPITGKVFLFTGSVDPGDHPEVAARMGLPVVSVTYGGDPNEAHGSSPDPAAVVMFDSFHTATNQPFPVGFVVEGMGYTALTGGPGGNFQLLFGVPTADPTAIPTAIPTTIPTADPTAIPTAIPTTIPTADPTANPTAIPTTIPTADPTAIPTAFPTKVAKNAKVPTAIPTAIPTKVAKTDKIPTAIPTMAPTKGWSPKSQSAGGLRSGLRSSQDAFVEAQAECPFDA